MSLSHHCAFAQVSRVASFYNKNKTWRWTWKGVSKHLSYSHRHSAHTVITHRTTTRGDLTAPCGLRCGGWIRSHTFRSHYQSADRLRLGANTLNCAQPSHSSARLSHSKPHVVCAGTGRHTSLSPTPPQPPWTVRRTHRGTRLSGHLRPCENAVREVCAFHARTQRVYCIHTCL